MNKDAGAKDLGQINQKVVAEGQSFPAVTMKDGRTIQTGTVATVLHNIDLYNGGERGAVEEELRLAVPTLFKAGLFKLFPPEVWVSGDNPGRKLVGEEAIRLQREGK